MSKIGKIGKIKFGLIIVLILHGLALIKSQNFIQNREGFVLNLVRNDEKQSDFKETVNSSPYFIGEKSLQIFPSEQIFIEIQTENNSILSMNAVRVNTNPEKTVIIKFEQRTEADQNLMWLDIKNPFDYTLKVEARILSLKGQWEKTSIVPIYEKTASYEIWYDVIKSIVIENWKFIDDERSRVVEKKIRRESYVNKKEETQEWLKSNGIVLNKLPLADKHELNYTCDSTLFLKQIINDTTSIWANGWQSPLDTTQILEFINKESYGKTSYLREVYKTGKVNGVYLRPYRFYTKKDSLFMEETFNHLSLDSMKTLFNQMIEVMDEVEKFDSLDDIISRNSYKRFKLIYHPNIFHKDIYNGNINHDIIKLSKRWRCDNEEYFEIEITTGTGNAESSTFYIFDQEYKWLKYDGCIQNGINCLKDENLIKTSDNK